MSALKVIVLNFILFGVLDFIWWGLLMKSFFKEVMGHLARYEEGVLNINFIPAILVYALMSSALYFFVHLNHLSTNFILAGFIGAFFGLSLFSVFDLTNLALLANYPLKMAVVDICWGTFMCGLISVIQFYFKPSL